MPAFVPVLILLVPTFLKADYIKGASYFAQGKYDLAIKEYEEELRSDPNYVQGYYIVGLCYARLKNYDRALENLKKAQSLDSKDFQISLALAQALFEAKKYPELKDALDSATRNARNPEDLQKLKSLQAAALFNQQDYAAALPELKTAVEADPKNEALQAQLGIAYFRVQRYDDAIAALSSATKLSAEDSQAGVFLGEAYFARGITQSLPRKRTEDLSEALRTAESVVNRDPKNFDGLSLAGRAALTLKHYAEASAFLKRAAEIQPDSAPTQFNLGQAYAFSGQLAEAETALTEAAKTLTTEPALYSILGFVLEKQNKLEAAEDAYTKAYGLAPTAELQQSIDRVKQKLTKK